MGSCDISDNHYPKNLSLNILYASFKRLCKEHHETQKKRSVRLVCGRPAGEAKTVCVKCCSIKVEKYIWFLELIGSELRIEHWISTPSMSRSCIKPNTLQIQMKITLGWLKLFLGKEVNMLPVTHAYTVTIICFKEYDKNTSCK